MSVLYVHDKKVSSHQEETVPGETFDPLPEGRFFFFVVFLNGFSLGSYTFLIVLRQEKHIFSLPCNLLAFVLLSSVLIESSTF